MVVAAYATWTYFVLNLKDKFDLWLVVTVTLSSGELNNDFVDEGRHRNIK